MPYDLEGDILADLEAAGSKAENGSRGFAPLEGPLDETTGGQGLGTERICELVKRQPKLFRLFDDVQYLAGHVEPRTTGLYDRRQKKVTRSGVEEVSI